MNSLRSGDCAKEPVSVAGAKLRLGRGGSLVRSAAGKRIGKSRTGKVLSINSYIRTFILLWCAS